MPGKVNPVINEFIISCAHKVYSNDMLITQLCGQGTLELNAYLPSIGDALLESLHLLISADQSMLTHIFKDMKTQSHTAYEKLMQSPSITTALLPLVGYEKASKMAHLMKQQNISIAEANNRLNILTVDQLEKALLPENLLKLGYSVNDI